MRSLRVQLQEQDEDFGLFLEKTYTTQKILEAALSLGCLRVGIHTRDDSFVDSIGWPFGTTGSLFADGKTPKNWPVAWRIRDKSGVSRPGSGNHGQASLICGPVHRGIYEYRDGAWIRTTTG